MTFLYTARGKFDEIYYNSDFSWDTYIQWSKLTHLKELVSLDGMLNEMLCAPNYENGDDWDFIHTYGEYVTGFHTTADFVLSTVKEKGKYNFLTVVIEPKEDCKDVNLDDYEFLGYDLLDQDFGISALSNCGGFDETFLPSDLNKSGLIDEFTKAYTIKKKLLENNPQEHHADTNVIAVWRHLKLGR